MESGGRWSVKCEAKEASDDGFGKETTKQQFTRHASTVKSTIAPTEFKKVQNFAPAMQRSQPLYLLIVPIGIVQM